ncbi:hypothetical protein ACNKHX_18180 [Shigella flexneri]
MTSIITGCIMPDDGRHHHGASSTSREKSTMQQLSFLPGATTPGERSLIQRALKPLDCHLHEPGVAFTSTCAAREWLILNMAAAA